MGETDTRVVKSASRVFEVLEIFKELRRPLGAREIVERCRYPKSSAGALLTSMTTMGYLSYDRGARVFFPTRRVAELGDWIVDSRSVAGNLIKLVQELHGLTGETVVVAMENDIYCQFLHVVASRHPVQFYMPAGSRTLLCSAGVGWAILSGQPDDSIEKLVKRTNLKTKSMAGGKVDFAKVMQRVRNVRQVGYSASWNTVIPEAGSIAMALPRSAGGARMAVAIGGLTKRLKPQTNVVVRAMRMSFANWGFALPAREG